MEGHVLILRKWKSTRPEWSVSTDITVRRVDLSLSKDSRGSLLKIVIFVLDTN